MSVLGNPILMLFNSSAPEPYFYDAGNEYTSTTGGWVKIGLNGSLNKNANYMKLIGNPQAAQTQRGFNFTDYSTLYFDIKGDANYEHSRVGLTETSGSTTFAYSEPTSANGRVTISVDTDAADGVFYPTVYTQIGSNGLYIYKVWADKKLFFFQPWKEYTTRTGGWVAAGTYSSFTKPAHMTITGQSASIKTVNSFDFTKYSKLYFELRTNVPSGSGYYARIGLTSSQNELEPTEFKTDKITAINTRAIYELDIRGANGLYYPTAYTTDSYNGIGVYNVWAE